MIVDLASCEAPYLEHTLTAIASNQVDNSSALEPMHTARVVSHPLSLRIHTGAVAIRQFP